MLVAAIPLLAFVRYEAQPVLLWPTIDRYFDIETGDTSTHAIISNPANPDAVVGLGISPDLAIWSLKIALI